MGSSRKSKNTARKSDCKPPRVQFMQTQAARDLARQRLDPMDVDDEKTDINDGTARNYARKSNYKGPREQFMNNVRARELGMRRKRRDSMDVDEEETEMNDGTIRVRAYAQRHDAINKSITGNKIVTLLHKLSYRLNQVFHYNFSVKGTRL